MQVRRIRRSRVCDLLPDPRPTEPLQKNRGPMHIQCQDTGEPLSRCHDTAFNCVQDKGCILRKDYRIRFLKDICDTVQRVFLVI